MNPALTLASSLLPPLGLPLSPAQPQQGSTTSRPQGLVGGAISLQGRATWAQPQSQGQGASTGRRGGPGEPRSPSPEPTLPAPEAMVTIRASMAPDASSASSGNAPPGPRPPCPVQWRPSHTGLGPSLGTASPPQVGPTPIPDKHLRWSSQAGSALGSATGHRRPPRGVSTQGASRPGLRVPDPMPAASLTPHHPLNPAP